MNPKTKLTIWLVLGILLAVGPLWGMLGTVVGMLMAFGELSQGAPEPSTLAGDISIALYTTAAGWIACPIGLVVSIVATFKLRHLEQEQN